MENTAAVSKVSIFQLLGDKEKPELGYKVLYSILAEFPKA